jgi:hypothetical protein
MGSARTAGEMSPVVPDLVEYWTLLPPAETDLLAGKHDGASKLAFALLKFYGRYGQVKVPAADLGLFEWDGRTVKRHRAEIRRFFGSASSRWRIPTS